jgi:hypothetical protein
MSNTFYFTRILDTNRDNNNKPDSDYPCSLEQIIVKLNTNDKSFMVTLITDIKIPYESVTQIHHIILWHMSI